MDSQKLDEELMKLNEGHKMVDMPASISLENADEYYRKNGYMTFYEFVDKVTKLV